MFSIYFICINLFSVCCSPSGFVSVCLPYFLSLYLYFIYSKDLFPSTTACSIDIAIGFDISGSRQPGEMLVSGHTKLQTFLPEIAHYMSSVQGLCCVGTTPIKPNIAYRVVSRDGRSLYDFNFEGYSEDVVRKVMTLNVAEPTYFNTAMLKSFGAKFQAESRAGVKVSLRDNVLASRSKTRFVKDEMELA